MYPIGHERNNAIGLWGRSPYTVYPETFTVFHNDSYFASGSLGKRKVSNPGPLPQQYGALPRSHHIYRRTRIFCIVA